MRMTAYEASKATGFLGGAGYGRQRFAMADPPANKKEASEEKGETVADAEPDDGKKPAKKKGLFGGKAAPPFTSKLSARHFSTFKSMQGKKFGK